MSEHQPNPFMEKFKGYFTSALRWEQLTELWERIDVDADGGWYIYAVGEQPPQAPAEADRVKAFTREIDALLRREHDEDYCGIVYADDRENPTMVKIYDPNNLGSVCGPGFGPPPLPGWLLSKIAPVDLEAAMPPPGNRRRWWQKFFS